MVKIGIIGVSVFLLIVAVSIIFIGSLPQDIEPEKIQSGSNIIGVDVDTVLNESTNTIFLDDIINGNEPDQTIDNVDITIDDEKTDIPQITQVDLQRTFTFNDGTKSRETVKVSDLEFALDFVAPKDELKPIDQGKINLSLFVNLQKPILNAEGEFTVYFGKTDLPVKKTFPKLDSDDTVNGRLQIFDETFNVSQLISTKTAGIHKLKLVMDKFYIIYDDNSRVYGNPDQLLYELEIEKNTRQTLVKNEKGEYAKVFDFDVPITVSSISQKVSAKMCLSNCNFGGCCKQYRSHALIPAPALGSVKIIDVSSGETVASKPANGQQKCAISDNRFVSTALSDCVKLEPINNSVTFNGQRGNLYKIVVSDPQHAWFVDVSENGGSYKWICKDKRTVVFVKSVYTRNGLVDIHEIKSERVCNFPNNGATVQ